MRCLFISYDGLTDPLGRSQILPYLEELSDEHELYVLSFEKPGRYKESGREVERSLGAAGIRWHPLKFSQGGNALFKLWDLLKMYFWAARLCWGKSIQLVHCRSYLAAQVALLLKRVFPLKVLFDMRGFWVDERIDSGAWRLSRLRDRLAFQFYKGLEGRLFANADHVISLTRAALPRVRQCLAGRPCEVTVIPCCADFEHFKLCPRLRHEGRQFLKVEPTVPLLCYSGGLGSWYLFPEMLDIFLQIRQASPAWRFLIITPDWTGEDEQAVRARGLTVGVDVIFLRGGRESMPMLLNACDLAISLIKPAASKIASSPTKLAEYWACGLPTISNRGVGDVEACTLELSGGIVIEDPSCFELSPQGLSELLSLDRRALRRAARTRLSLEVAGALYREVYQALESSNQD